MLKRWTIEGGRVSPLLILQRGMSMFLQSTKGGKDGEMKVARGVGVSGSDLERLRTNLIAANRAGWPNYRPGIR